MNKPILALTAVLAFSALPAFAQDTSAEVGVDASAGISAELPSAEAGANVDAGGAMNATANDDNTYGSVVSSFDSSASVDLSGITDDAQVRIVLLSGLEGKGADNSAALDNKISANAEALDTLHANIDSNAVIKAKVEAMGHTTDDIVAVKTAADGTLIVYVDDRA